MRGRDTDTAFSHDVLRTVILDTYIRCWGVPEQRVQSRKGEETIEVYFFRKDSAGVRRVSTVGLSTILRKSAGHHGFELFMVLPNDFGGASVTEVSNFLLDVAVYSLRDDVHIDVGATIPETPLMPKSWNAKALLLDEPRGEREELESIPIGQENVRPLWLIPIYEAELRLIEKQGIAEFDKRVDASEWSLADPNRPATV